MAIHPRGMICVLTEEESDRWKSTGIRPDCRTHRHASLSTAIRWHDYPKFNDLVKVAWAGRNAIMVERKESRILRTMLSGGVPVVQLIPGPKIHVFGIKCWCGSTHNRTSGGIPACGAHTRRQSVLEINSEGPRCLHAGKS